MTLSHISDLSLKASIWRIGQTAEFLPAVVSQSTTKPNPHEGTQRVVVVQHLLGWKQERK